MSVLLQSTPRNPAWVRARPRVSTAARLALGAVWLVAGATKVNDLVAAAAKAG